MEGEHLGDRSVDGICNIKMELQIGVWTELIWLRIGMYVRFPENEGNVIRPNCGRTLQEVLCLKVLVG
jgi:hypothetical protein